MSSLYKASFFLGVLSVQISSITIISGKVFAPKAGNCNHVHPSLTLPMNKVQQKKTQGLSGFPLRGQPPR